MNNSDSESGKFSPSYPRLVALALLVLGVVIWLTFGDGTVDEPTPAQQQVEEVEQTASSMLQGRVVDDGGRAVGAARVSVDGESVTTDDEGYFQVEHLEEGTRLVDVHAADYVRPGVGDAALAAVIIDGEPIEELELVVQQPATVTGRVTAEAEPVAGAAIGLSYLDARGLDGSGLDAHVIDDVATTDENGRFSLADVPPGRLTVVAQRGDDTAESSPMVLTPGEDGQKVNIDLEPSGRIRGQVTGTDGQRLDAEGTLQPAYADNAADAFVVDAGRFELERLHPGNWTVTLEAEGHRTRTLEDVVITGDEATTVDVELEESRGLVGYVVEPDGTAAVDASVTVDSDDGRSRRLETDGEGRFQWEEITDGEWTVVADSPHHNPSEPTSLQPHKEAQVQLQPGGRITGQVVDASGRFIDRFSVTLTPVEIDGEDQHHLRQRGAEQFDDRRGRFEVGPVPSGRYQLVVEAEDGPEAISEPVEVNGGSRVGPITVELEMDDVNDDAAGGTAELDERGDAGR